MANLLLRATTTEELYPALARVLDGRIVASEHDGQTHYLAVERQGITTAVILRVTPLQDALPDGSNVAVCVQGERDNPQAARASHAITKQLSAELFAGLSPWRVRCAEWQARVKRAALGQELLGEYPEADGFISYNPAAKEAFAADARRYLKRVLKELGWVGTVRFNPGGIAVSGEVMLRASVPNASCSLFVELSCCLYAPLPISPSGVAIMWRLEPLEGPSRFERPYGNRWCSWQATSDDLVARIQRAVAAFDLPQSA
ncbi:hypothetical protein [Deinococcus ruber]|uniref:Uncharacterized protein n=1 Tax=Deinococcus ruber TaxID=1848197 RepID=A0A918CBV0_9DEIO|nr:hypothetical protein [Deinococcus ruber]GGR13339.1 hypothetical protein GCM10008957_27870 [Deinococcus ruber]